MKQRILPAVSLVSLACLAVLACGYFGLIGIQKKAGHALQSNLVIASDGRIAFWRTRGAVLLSPSLLHIGTVQFALKLRPVRAPELRRCIWEFDAHRVDLGGNRSALLIACPIWCVALPLLIAPALWLWKRRQKRHEPPGFTVIAEATARHEWSGTLVLPSSYGVADHQRQVLATSKNI